jgi:hypothetical protein
MPEHFHLGPEADRRPNRLRMSLLGRCSARSSTRGLLGGAAKRQRRWRWRSRRSREPQPDDRRCVHTRSDDHSIAPFASQDARQLVPPRSRAVPGPRATIKRRCQSLRMGVAGRSQDLTMPSQLLQSHGGGVQTTGSSSRLAMRYSVGQSRATVRNGSPWSSMIHVLSSPSTMPVISSLH